MAVARAPQDTACLVVGAAPTLNVTAASVSINGGAALQLPASALVVPPANGSSVAAPGVLVLDLGPLGAYVPANASVLLAFNYTAALGGGGGVAGKVRLFLATGAP